VGLYPRPAVFLDRDGVINDVVLREGKSFPPDDVAHLRILPGVATALHALKQAGFPLVVVTNQPDVGAGLQTRDRVEAIHDRLRATLPLDAIEVCFHTDLDACACRKPRTGMLENAARRMGLDLGRSFLVGDRWRDIEAGTAVGCTTFWIDRAYAERAPACFDHRVASLLEASRTILTLHASGLHVEPTATSPGELNP